MPRTLRARLRCVLATLAVAAPAAAAVPNGLSPDLDAVHINAEFSDQGSDHYPPITRLDVR